MTFELDEVRRLTGPNLLSDEPGAIIDVFFSDVESQAVIDCWRKHLYHCQVTLGSDYAWPLNCYERLYNGGASMSISAPMDLLYSACDLIELAWDLCVAELSAGSEVASIVYMLPRLAALKATIVDERQPKLLAFMRQAQINNVVCLVDDDEISLGMGAKSETWPIDKFPDPKSVNWQQYSTIPLALVTGTNGKSTSVRLAAEIAKAASLNAGVTSTDFIKVGDTIIDDGDYSGPGGARLLLRDKRTEIAFLEVARGGLLRRGLPVQSANVALVTNVAGDHLGQYGINTVEEIASVKSMVSKAIQKGTDFSKGTLVLNADDALLVTESKNINVPICWFSENENNPLIVKALSQNNPCVFVRNSKLVYSHIEQEIIATITDIPMTVNGTAKHNIQNALGVIGLTKALGISSDAVLSGLINFGSDATDNPGRGNIYEVNGVTVIVDFAHNSHSMQALVNMASNMPAKAKHVMFSHAGDRSDKDILDVANAVSKLQPSTYVLAEINRYLRGREPNEISLLVKHHLIATGIGEKDIILTSNPIDGTKKIMDRAASGDLVLLFVLDERDKVQALLTDKYNLYTG
ncbi:MAG: cyanophycin synthetase [Glaciecola sp.]|jgi:cyanophycin synthetase